MAAQAGRAGQPGGPGTPGTTGPGEPDRRERRAVRCAALGAVRARRGRLRGDRPSARRMRRGQLSRRDTRHPGRPSIPHRGAAARAGRYAAAAAVGSRDWLFGGRTAAGPTDVIQQVDLGTGTARVVGHLPYRLTGAAAFELDGTIYLAGGRTTAAAAPGGPAPAGSGRPGRAASAAVLRYQPGRGHLAVAGQLPVPVAGAAAAVIGGTAYLVGGTDGRRLVPAVTTLRLVRQDAGPCRPPPPGPGGPRPRPSGAGFTA